MASVIFGATVAGVARAAAADHRVVIEVTSGKPEAWSGVLRNVENLREALGSAAVEVVAHGEGLGMLRPSANAAVAERLRVQRDQGVEFAACANTMRREGVTKADLVPFATVVDSGVAEVVRKQEAGWSYLRSGS